MADDPLSTWKNLNACLTGAGEDLCIKLLREEQLGKRRKQFLLRIYSRLNKVRADRERKELVEEAAG
jgi:hypothetical protein